MSSRPSPPRRRANTAISAIQAAASTSTLTSYPHEVLPNSRYTGQANQNISGPGWLPWTVVPIRPAGPISGGWLQKPTSRICAWARSPVGNQGLPCSATVATTSGTTRTAMQARVIAHDA